jgi:hypothetical protein
MNAMNLTLPQSSEDRPFTDIALSRAAQAPGLVLHLGINNSDDLIRLCKSPKTTINKRRKANES